MESLAEKHCCKATMSSIVPMHDNVTLLAPSYAFPHARLFLALEADALYGVTHRHAWEYCGHAGVFYCLKFHHVCKCNPFKNKTSLLQYSAMRFLPLLLIHICGRVWWLCYGQVLYFHCGDSVVQSGWRGHRTPVRSDGDGPLSRAILPFIYRIGWRAEPRKCWGKYKERFNLYHPNSLENWQTHLPTQGNPHKEVLTGSELHSKVPRQTGLYVHLPCNSRYIITYR